VKVTQVDLDADGYTGVVTFEMKGIRATIESGSVSHFGWEEHTQVYFPHGWVRVDSPALLQKNSPARIEVYRGGEVQQTCYPQPDPPYTWSYRREAEHFVDCLASGQPFRSSGEDTLTDIRLFEDVFRLWGKR
jgi:predicted dehydrogenase